MLRITVENLSEVFSYHAPTPDQVERMNRIRDKAAELAQIVLEVAPEVPDRTRCLNQISDLCMLANKAIILEEVK